MTKVFSEIAAALIAAAALTAASSLTTIDQMRWHRRVLLIAAPDANDPRLVAQRRALDAWKMGAAARDLSPVDVVGDVVHGSADDADALRSRHHLSAAEFLVVLIGKDGHEALRSSKPVSAAVLSSTIDAMPMRRAGQR